MGIFGWSYPPGAENDPSAPWNQTDDEEPEMQTEQIVLDFFSATDREQAKRHAYKYTDCGMWLEFLPEGIRLGSIVEGCDFDTATYTLYYEDNFTSADIQARIDAIEAEASALWKWVNEQDGEGDAPDVAFDYRHLNPD